MTYSNYSNRDVRHEFCGIELCREELEDWDGKIKLYWTLRDENGNIVLQTKNKDCLIVEMMIRAVQYEKEMPLLRRRI